jgi:two-component system, LytTR family, response regulator
MEKVILNSKNHVIPANILFFKGDVNYSIAYYSNGKKETIVKSLKHIESELKQHDFYRIHKSFLINLEYVSQKPVGFNIELTNEYVLTVARRKISGLRKKLKNKK